MEAIRHPGFSLVQILSPCVTFRPEQREWKHMLVPSPKAPTSDPAEAARRLLRDHGLYTGILYVGDRPVYQPKHEPGVEGVEAFEEEFSL